VRLFKETSTSFELVPFLDLFGAGTINNPTGTGYIFDSANTPISSVAIFAGQLLRSRRRSFSFWGSPIFFRSSPM